MKKISFAEISIFVVNKIFNWRFWIAGLTRKSKVAKKVINKIESKCTWSYIGIGIGIALLNTDFGSGKKQTPQTTEISQNSNITSPPQRKI